MAGQLPPVPLVVGVPAAWPQPCTPLLRQIIDLGAVAFSLREMQSHWLRRSFEKENENNKLRIQSIQKKLSKRISAYKWTYTNVRNDKGSGYFMLQSAPNACTCCFGQFALRVSFVVPHLPRNRLASGSGS